MQATKRSELIEGIRNAVALFRDAGRRFLNKDIVDAVIEANGPLFDELGSQLAREKLFDLTRRVMKSAAEITEAAAQLDLGLDADLDANLGMLDLQIKADQRKRHSIFLLRQRVVAVVGEDSAFNVAQAAAMARELQPV